VSPPSRRHAFLLLSQQKVVVIGMLRADC